MGSRDNTIGFFDAEVSAFLVPLLITINVILAFP